MYEEMDVEQLRLSSWASSLGYQAYTKDLCRDMTGFGVILSTILTRYGLTCRPRNSQIIEVSQYGQVATIYYVLGKGYLYSIRRSYYVEPLRIPTLEALLQQVISTFQCGGCHYSTKAGTHTYCAMAMVTGGSYICTGYHRTAL